MCTSEIVSHYVSDFVDWIFLHILESLWLCMSVYIHAYSLFLHYWKVRECHTFARVNLHMDESCHVYNRDMSHTWIESCHNETWHVNKSSHDTQSSVRCTEGSRSMVTTHMCGSPDIVDLYKRMSHVTQCVYIQMSHVTHCHEPHVWISRYCWPV